MAAEVGSKSLDHRQMVPSPPPPPEPVSVARTVPMPKKMATQRTRSEMRMAAPLPFDRYDRKPVPLRMSPLLSAVTRCQSVADCVAIKRIADCLCFYQSLDVEEEGGKLLAYLDGDYPFLMDDYHHILMHHLGDGQAIEGSRAEFEAIHQIVMAKLKRCALGKCPKLRRNRRDRDGIDEKQPESPSANGLRVSIDFLDTIHVHLVHTFDIGYRLRSDEMRSIYRRTEPLDEDDRELSPSIGVSLDNEMQEMRRILCSKQDGLRRYARNGRLRKHNKFSTTTSTEDSNYTPSTPLPIATTKFDHDGDGDDDDDDQKKEENANSSSFPFPASCSPTDAASSSGVARRSEGGFYSFGCRFYYWPKYERMDAEEHEGLNQGSRYKDMYVRPKYGDLEAEVTGNRISKLSRSAFKTAVQKAGKLRAMKMARKMTAKYPTEQTDYGVKFGSTMTVPHLLSVVLYTDFSKLSFWFSSTFRRLSAEETLEQQKARNAEFGIWSKLLRETVELFGTDMSESSIAVFYHGVSKLIFSSFVSYFGSPTSTTAQLEVATMFADHHGLILELQPSKRSLCYFNCSWLSCFSNEDERILCGGLFPMHFGSIRDMNAGIDYRPYVHALTSFDYALSGHSLFHGQHDVAKMDRKIVRALWRRCDAEQSTTASFPEYIENTFLAFCRERKSVSIVKPRLDKRGTMERLLFGGESSNVVRLELFSVFEHLEAISVEFDPFFRPSVDEAFLEEIVGGLGALEARLKRKVAAVFKKVRVDAFEGRWPAVTSQFAKRGWILEIFKSQRIQNLSIRGAATPTAPASGGGAE